MALLRQNYDVTHHPPSAVVQLLHSSTDPGQITSNCIFHYYVSNIVVVPYKIILLLKPMSNFNKLDQLILDVVLVS
jgi:hypothetical protein